MITGVRTILGKSLAESHACDPMRDSRRDSFLYAIIVFLKLYLVKERILK